MFVVSFSGCPSVCHWHRLFVLSFLRRTWKNLKKTYFTFYRNDNHMSPIVKLNRATFHTGEPIEWVLLGEVHWRGGEYYWIWGLLKILGKTRDHVYLGICRSRIDRYYRSTCRPSVHRPVGWYLTSLSTKYRSTCQTKSVASWPTRRRLPFQNNTYHRQSTDTPPTLNTLSTVDRNVTVEVSAKCRPTYRTGIDRLRRPTVNSMATGSRPTIDRLVNRESTECRSTCRPIVSVTTRPTDTLSTHDLKYEGCLSLSFHESVCTCTLLWWENIHLPLMLLLTF